MQRTIFAILAAGLLALPAHAQTLDRIKQTGKLNFGYRVDAAPLSYQNASGDPAGYSPQVCIHIVEAIAKTLELEKIGVSFIPVGTDDRFEKVASGEIDLLCGAATITLGRREIVDFSTPTFVDGTAILQLNGTSAQFSDLAGKKLGVRGDTTTKEALINSLRTAAIDADIFSFASHDAGIAALEAKEIVAYFADKSILAHLYMNSEKSGNFQISDQILTVEKQGLALARGDADFRLLVDTALSEMFASGKMQEIFKEAMPGAQPGLALGAMYLLSPTIR